MANKHHNIKCHPEYYKAIASGLKTFEVRLNDRDYEVNDTVTIQEFKPENSYYTGKETDAVITYVLRDYTAVIPGYVVFGFKKIPEGTGVFRTKLCPCCYGSGLNRLKEDCGTCKGTGIYKEKGL